MPCYIRMKRTFLQGLLWLYLLGFGFMALSLEPGYLDFDNLPDTNFSCVGKVIGGYYADLETNCQMFHVCTIGQLDEPMDIRFLCLNGTVFDQETRVCERIDEVDCSKSEQFYSLNLELYGNTQPATLEESPETEQPLVIKSTTTTTTTTLAPKTTRAPFYTTATTPRATTPSPQVISTHHFPVVNSPDIRFNPEEINISLHPGAPPDIRTKPVTYHQHGFSDNNKKVVVTAHSDNSDNKKVTVITHTPVFDDEKVLPPQEQGFIERPQVQVKNSPQTVHYGPGEDRNKNFNRPTPSDINFGFTYHQTGSNDEYHTEDPQEYHFHSDYRPSQDYSGHHHRHNPHVHHFKSSTFRDDYTTTTSKANLNNFQQNAPTTSRNYYLQSLTPPAPNQHDHYNQHRTDKPQRLQLPLPLLPTLPPLTFSSPAPFALQRHIETKRYTKDHQAPPRIIISASASVSDASGRRLNYSLGTIGAAEILDEPPSSYDEYKEADVGLDPFFHDVPKIKRSRSKRDVGLQLTPKDVIKNEKEAETVLKFLVDWYEDNKMTITTDPTVNKMIDDSRSKRQVTNKIKHSDIIRNEQEAVDVLKFLLEWYKDNEKSTTIPTISTSTEIREEITSTTKRGTAKNNPTDLKAEELSYKNSDLFNKNSKFSIVGREPGLDDSITPIYKKNNTSEGKVSFLRRDEDYVNDNFEPITYNEKYGKTQANNSLKSLGKEAKNKTLPTDYVDDNVEPIYYRDRNTNALGQNLHNKESFVEDSQPAFADSNTIIGQIYHDIKELNNALLDTNTGESKVHVVGKDEDARTNNIDRITGQINHDIKELNDALLTPKSNKEESSTKFDIRPNIINKTQNPINHESKELNEALLGASFEESKEASSENGDIKTNNIDKSRTNQINTDFKDVFLTPQFDATTINVVSTEKTPTLPTSLRSRGNRKRGRGRTSNTINTNTIRTKEKKNMVIEKITEKAHTAKDDFNYLRTLYKVLSTTPMYNLSEEANPYLKLKKTSSNHSDDRDIFSQNIDLDGIESEEDKTHSESRNVPIVTTEQTTTSSPPSRRANRRRGRVKEQPTTTRRTPSRRRKITTTEPTKDTDLVSTTQPSTVNYDFGTPTEEIKTTQNLATVDPRAVNWLEIGQNEANDETSTTNNFFTRSEVFETTTIIPTITTDIDNLETQTAFFNELTQNYKRLFKVLTSTGAGDTQPSTTLDPIKIFGPHLVTTEPFNTWRRGFGTTISPIRREEKNFYNALLPSLEPPNYSTQSPTTILFDNGQFRKRIGNVESVRYSTLPASSEKTDVTERNHISTVAQDYTGRSAATIPTTLSDLYKEVNIDTINGKVLLQAVKNNVATSTEEINTESYKKMEESSDLSTKKYGVEETENYPTTTTESYETSTIENLATTQVANKRAFKEEDDDDEPDNSKSVEDPHEHVLQENRHFLSSFTQSFSFTEEMDKDIPTIHESEILTKEVREGLPFPTAIMEETTTSQTITEGTTKEVYKTTTDKENYEVPTTLAATDKMMEFIKEIEATTKSVVVGTEQPLTERISTKAADSKLTATTEMEDTLKGLVEEIEDMTKSKIGATTLEFMTQKSQRTKAENITGMPSTLEQTTVPTTILYDDRATQKSEPSTYAYVPTIRSTLQKYFTNRKVFTTEKPKIIDSTTALTSSDAATIEEKNTTTTVEIVTTTAEIPTSTQLPTTTEQPSDDTETTTTTERPVGRGRGAIRRGGRRGSRPPVRRNPVISQRNIGRHRFSTDSFTKRPEGRKQTIEEEIIDEIASSSQQTSTESLKPSRRRIKKRKRIHALDDSSTDPPLQRSVSATRADGVRLPTTPLSKTTDKHYIFNCFGKEMDKFYPDHRDCRLFHYCTQGYSKNQLLDMKFVCDQNTYFDDEKLICTKQKPRRCL